MAMDGWMEKVAKAKHVISYLNAECVYTNKKSVSTSLRLSF